MDGTTAERLWRVTNAAGRPWPVLDDDDVVDFMIMEAVALKINKQDKQAEDRATKKAWMKDKEGLDKLRDIAG